MARFPSGIASGSLPGADVDDPHVRAARLALTMDENPLGQTAPCVNPECAGPVDYLGTGALALYCSRTCRSRASTLRRSATQQLALIERTLTDTKHMHGVPRQAMRSRARTLQWWLARLAPLDEVTEPS